MLAEVEYEYLCTFAAVCSVLAFPKTAVTVVLLLVLGYWFVRWSAVVFLDEQHDSATTTTATTTTTTSSDDCTLLSRRFYLLFLFAVRGGSAGRCQQQACKTTEDESAPQDFVTTSSGLRYQVLRKGQQQQQGEQETTTTTTTPVRGQSIRAHYTGWLDGFDSSKLFDSTTRPLLSAAGGGSSSKRKRIKPPIVFQVGKGHVIEAWDEAFLNMQVGECRRVVVPPSLGYGESGAGKLIPSNATLYFELELLEVIPPQES